jgi:chemotaxis protein CheZ
MAVRRKVFRIEEMDPLAATAGALDGASLAERHEIMAELKALRGLVERRDAATPALGGVDPARLDTHDLERLKTETETIRFALARTKQEIATLHIATLDAQETSRVTRELDAVAESTERATGLILTAAEAIDEAANNLSASLKNEQEAALALDIQDNVLRIFEACNFQDISGQRIAKVLATLKFVEERIACMVEIWGGVETLRPYAATLRHERPDSLLHGPKLDGDSGHASQDDVDRMFATG